MLLDNKNQNETVYVTKRYKDNKYTKNLKKFAIVFDFSKEALNNLHLGWWLCIVFCTAF